MKRVVVGIPVRERVDRLERTLEALRAFAPSTPVVLLADAPDASTRRALASVGCDRVLSWDRARGDSHCFNRLVTDTPAEAYVLLENGALVSPGWLERLLGVLEADPAHGLCGPSTNRSWNEQQVFPNAGGEHDELVRTAAEAGARFENGFVELTPLHSLGDFCYVVKREVVERIGAADEGYADGPCWEMDYNVRAARAGFRGLWVKAAFVWRAPETSRRRVAEARRFEFSKRRYQQHFCALQLRKQTQHFEAHCKGEACEHFAPNELIALRRELPYASGARPSPASPASPASSALPAPPRAVFPPPPEPVSVGERPLVSCIMPTANRRAFVAQAISAFLDQDYESRELVIVDDGSDCIEDLVPKDERIRYVARPAGQSLGKKRNEACELARGEVIVHWDDDDWHAPWRLSYQISRLVSSGADICGLDRLWFYEPDTRRAFQYRYPGGRSRWLAGSSFCYRKKLWQRLRFADVTVGEDTRFVREATFARVTPLERDDFLVARVHVANTCRKQTGSTSWTPVAREAIEELIARCESRLGTPRILEPPAPDSLVSCIMPTFNRPAFVALALRRFAEQTYRNKELIVVDDGAVPVERLVATVPNVRYLRVDRRSIGEKRNAACHASRGQIIVHWDDDDWYGPERVARQIEPILAGRADLTGLRCRWVMKLPEGDFWQISPELHRKMFVADVHGGTLAFRKGLWEAGARYPSTNLAEDAEMLRSALRAGARLEALAGDRDFVYSRHGSNAWNFAAGVFIDPSQWQKSPSLGPMNRALVEDYCGAHRKNADTSARPRDEREGTLRHAPLLPDPPLPRHS